MKTFLISLCIIGFFGSLANGLIENCICYIAFAVIFVIFFSDGKKNKTNKKIKQK